MPDEFAIRMFRIVVVDAERLAVQVLKRNVDYRILFWSEKRLLEQVLEQATLDKAYDDIMEWFLAEISSNQSAYMALGASMWRACRMACVNVLIGFEYDPSISEDAKKIPTEQAQQALAAKYGIKGDLPILIDWETGNPYD